MSRIFPGFSLNGLGNPLTNGTFRFDKGTSRGFLYKNLSGGEKAVSWAATEIYDQAYLVDRRPDIPEQYRAIGWCQGRLCSVIFEIRQDRESEDYHLITAWKATKEEEQGCAENV